MRDVLRLLTKERDLIAVIDHYTQLNYESKLSEATSWSVSIPVTDVKAPELDIARYVEVVDQLNRTRFSGKIAARSVEETTATASGFSEEIELERALTPAQYGAVLSGHDLATVARELCWERAVLRRKDQSEWQANAGSLNVDVTTEPGLVVLAKTEGHYRESGYIIQRFDATHIPDFTSWERIRWAADNDPPVSTTMQYRYGNTVGTLTGWSAEVPGVLTDELGVVPAATSQRYLEVRINLYTEDTTSDDIGFSPAVFAVEVVAKTRRILSEAGVVGSTGESVMGLRADSDTHLAVLQQACQQVGYEFRVREGTLYLAEELGEDRTADVLLRNGSNIRVDTLGDHDEELVNVLTAYGPGVGINRLQVLLRDPSSIERYGVYPGTQEFPTATSLVELTDKAAEYLSSHKDPQQAYQVEATFALEDEPYLELGDLVTVADPRSGVVGEVRLLGLVRNVTPDSAQLTLDLGTPPKSLVEAILDDIDPDRTTRLALAVPVGLRATPANPGISVSVNPYVNSRSAGVEVHMSDGPSFVPSTATLVARGQATTYVVTGTTAGERYYFKARSYDARGEYSAFTSEVSTIAGGVSMDDVTGEIPRARFAEGIRPVLVGTDLPSLPDPANVLVGDLFAHYEEVGGDAVLMLAVDTDDDGFADVWKPAVNTEDLQGVIAGNRILANSISAAQIAAGAIRASELAAEAVTAEKIGAGAIGARHIQAGAITAGMLRLTGVGNFVPNPAFEEGQNGLDHWQATNQTFGLNDNRFGVGTSTSFFGRASPGPNGFGWVGYLTAGSQRHGVYATPWFPVAPYDSLYLGAWVRRDTGGVSASLYLSVVVERASGSPVLWTFIFNPNSVDAGWRWVEKTLSLVIANATRARVVLYIPGVSPAYGRWYFTGVTARPGVDTRLLVDGTIEISNSEKNLGALSVRTSNNIEVLRLGNVSGKSGVPTGTSHGLWGRLGTGVFIEGAERVIHRVGRAGINYSGSPLSHPGGRMFTAYSPIYSFGSYQVPGTRGVRALVNLVAFQAYDGAWLVWPQPGTPPASLHNMFANANLAYLAFTPELRRSGVWTDSPIRSQDTIDAVRVKMTGVISTNFRTLTDPTVTAEVEVTVQENDYNLIRT